MTTAERDIKGKWTELPVEHIRPDPTSPRRRQRRSVSEIAKSISEFGILQPIVVDEHFTVIIGHGRLEAARQLKCESVPTVVLSGITDAARRRLQIADNRLSELSDWNEARLIEHIEQLENESNAAIPGFDALELNDLLGIHDISKANSELPPHRENTVAYSELHLLVSCQASKSEQMARLIADLTDKSWCTVEQGAR